MLALGDSYTIGEGVTAEERWVSRLAELLQARGVRLQPAMIVARTGWTTDELLAAIDAADPRGPFDLVTLLIGVNDQYRGRTTDDFRPGFRTLLARAIAFAGDRVDRVLVLSIPDWSVTPFARGRDAANIAAEIDAFNAVCRNETLAVGASYVDITPISRTAADDAGLLAGDGLHPSGRMYAAWAELALGRVRV
ncbi:MAG: SGNH/GDSL hydrolase family protein [Gemmatimonadaceae bacterium]